jgi:hypothetical protein
MAVFLPKVFRVAVAKFISIREVAESSETAGRARSAMNSPNQSRCLIGLLRVLLQTYVREVVDSSLSMLQDLVIKMPT